MIKAVIFDIDRVLVDSLRLNLMYFNDLFRKFGGKEFTLESYKPLYHLSSKQLIMKFFPEKPPEQVQDILDYSRTIGSKYFKHARLNPGVPEMLEWLGMRYKLGIVSNRRMFDILNHFRIARYFDVKVGALDVKNHKPHPEPLLLALERLEVLPDEAVYIGDARSDLETGRAAGIPVVIYGNDMVRGDFNISDFSELKNIVRGME